MSTPEITTETSASDSPRSWSGNRDQGGQGWRADLDSRRFIAAVAAE
jgi:hypothetical protein